MAKNVDITSYKATVKIDTRSAVKSVESLQKALKSLDKQLSMSTTGKAFDKLKQTAKLQNKAAATTQKTAKRTNKIKADGAKAEKKANESLIRSSQMWIAGNLNFHKLRMRNAKQALKIERDIAKAAAAGDRVRIASLKKQVMLANQASGGGGVRGGRGGVRTGVIAGLTASNVAAGLSAVGAGALLGGIVSTSNKYQQAEIGLEAAMLGSGHFETEGFKGNKALQEKAIQNQKSFAYSMALNYGLDQASTTMDLGKFMVSALSTVGEDGTVDEKMNISQIQSLFQGLSKQGVLYGLGQDQMKRAMNAFTQMANKGQIKAEELKNQLGDVLPGAMKLFADAIGKTQGELLEMMDRGELLAWDVLPLVAKEMNRVADAGGKFEEALNKPSKQIDILVARFKDLAIGMGMQFEKPFVDIIKTVTGFLKEFRTPIAEIGGTFIESFMVDAKGALESFLNTLRPFLNEWKGLTSEDKIKKVRSWATAVQNAFTALFLMFSGKKLLGGIGGLLELFNTGKIPRRIDKIGNSLKKLIPIVTALAAPLLPILSLGAGVATGMGINSVLGEETKHDIGKSVAQLLSFFGHDESTAALKNAGDYPSDNFLFQTKDSIFGQMEQHEALRNAVRNQGRFGKGAYSNIPPMVTFDVSVEQNNTGSGVLSMDEMERRGNVMGSSLAQSASEQYLNYLNSSVQ